MVKERSYYEAWDKIGRPSREDFENKEIMNSSVFKRFYYGLNDFFHLLRHPRANASKVVNYDKVFEERKKAVEETQKYKQDVINLGERLGEVGEEKRKIVGELSDLAHDYVDLNDKRNYLFDRACELSDRCRELEEVAGERGGIIKQQRSVMHQGKRYLVRLEKELEKKNKEISDARSRMQKILHPIKKIDKRQQERDATMTANLIGKLGMTAQEMLDIKHDDGIKGLRNKYVELLHKKREGEERKDSKFIKFGK